MALIKCVTRYLGYMHFPLGSPTHMHDHEESSKIHTQRERESSRSIKQPAASNHEKKAFVGLIDLATARLRAAAAHSRYRVVKIKFSFLSLLQPT